MSPEQIRGRPADARSDIFAIGAILYEMATGKRAFHKESAPETMTAILTEDPPALDVADAKLPPGLARIVSHCLEKIPEERFQSARDLAFGLQALSGTSATAASSAPAPAVRARRRRVLMAAGALGLVLAAVMVAFVLGRWTAAPAPIVFKRVTFRHGTLSQGRFTGDGRAIIYSARWGTSPEQLFLTNIGNPETRPFDLPVLQLLAVAPSGELAVMLHPDFQGGFIFTGTLARVPAAGGAPREILEAVQAAEWGPDSQSLAIVRNVAGTSRLEYPIGHVLFNTAGWINFPRLSPNGDAIAFLHHPLNGDDAGEVVVVDLAGNARRISSGWLSAEGLAWSGNEVWFTATATGQERRIYAATTTGSVRFVAGGTGSLTLYDVAKDGRLLVSRDSDRIGIAVRGPGDAQERDLSWLDWSLIRQVSEDGRTIVFDETGEGGGQRQGVFVRGLDGSPAVRLGDGTAPALSKDGRWVACVQGHPPRLVILPTGPGEARSLPTPGLQTQSVHWFPDGTRLLLAAAAPGHALRYYVQSLTGGTARPVTPEGASIFTHGLSDSGRLLLTSIAGTFGLFDVETGARRDVTMLKPSDRVVRMVGETSAYVTERNRLPTDLSLVDLTTGRRTVVGTIGTSKTAAVPSTFGVAVSADGHTYAYSYLESTSELYVVEEVPR